MNFLSLPETAISHRQKARRPVFLPMVLPLVPRCVLALALAGLIAPWPASDALAQIQLPGAVRGPSQTGPATPATPDAKPAPRREGPNPADPGAPVMVRAPGERSLSGRTLSHNGQRGSMRFVTEDGQLRIASLTLSGDVISRVGESCEVEVPGAPFSVTASGRDEGLLKFKVESESCPFEISVLDGSVVAIHGGARASSGLGAGTCEFKEKDCRGYLAGVWGPAGRTIGKGEAAGIEKVRGAAERNARANFRALLRRAGGDRTRTRELASDQAGFSARREEICRDYMREHQHGFCASRITQARAVSLAAQMGSVQVDDGKTPPEAKPKPKPRPRPRPPADAGAPRPPQGPLPAQLQPLR